MNIDSFDWDDENVRHISRHQVNSDEVEEVFESWYYLHRVRDGRYIVLGQSAAGRYLFCVIERSARWIGYRVVTARDMEASERKLFKRHR